MLTPAPQAADKKPLPVTPAQPRASTSALARGDPACASSNRQIIFTAAAIYSFAFGGPSALSTCGLDLPAGFSGEGLAEGTLSNLMTNQFLKTELTVSKDSSMMARIQLQQSGSLNPRTFTLIITSDDLLEATSCFVVKQGYTFPVQPSLTLEGSSLYMIMPVYTQPAADSSVDLELECVNSVSAPAACGQIKLPEAKPPWPLGPWGHLS
jgi:hypothetical protein